MAENLSLGQGKDYSSEALINFQLEKLSIKQKSDYSFGFKVAQDIESKVNGGTSTYFFVRNQRWKTNRNYANGRVNMSRFQDLLEFNGKVNYVNINWQCIHIVNRVISGLVGRWMTRNEKISVKAIDTLSVKQKQEQFEELEFIVDNRKMLEKLQEESGVQMMPDKDIPADREELLLWQSQFQRLPEEILYEIGCNDAIASCGFFDVMKDKLLHDSAETGFVATYTWMDDEGVIHIESLKPENCFYSYSGFNDFRDTSWRGHMTTYKISELRRKYGREFHPDDPHSLTEEQLFNLAATAKEYKLYDNITWATEWNVSYLRPYDEWNVDVMEFELRTVDSEKYTITVTEKNKRTIIEKGTPKKKKDNQTIVEDSKINIYRGVYCRSTQQMLEWGLKKNMIRPQDPKEIGNAEFSYSFYMVQNYDMMCMAIPEKIQEPADQMIIARLKIQQLVASSRPPGTAINWRAVQNVDYGLGEGNKSIDFKKMYDQTGSFYYRDTDAEGNPIGVPFTEIPNAGFAQQMEALIALYNFHYQVMKDELGEDPNLISQAAQPRVAVANIEAAQMQSAYSVDYFYDAYKNVMADTARKVSCLLKNSVKYGSQVYRNIIDQDDIGDRIFTTQIQMLPSEIEVQKFEALLNQALATSPDLVLFVDPFQLMRIAKEDVKLAEALFRQAQKKSLLHQQNMQRENLQMTIQGQQQSAQMAEQEKRVTEQMKIQGDIQKSEVAALSNNRTAVVNMVTAWLKPDANGMVGKVPTEYQPFVKGVFESILVDAVAKSDEQKEKMLQEMEAAQDASQQTQSDLQLPNQNQQVA